MHHFCTESNQPSAEWTAAGESRPKRSKRQTSAGKVLAFVSWDAQGILFIDYLQRGRIINSEYHIVLLVRLKEEISPHPQKTTTNEEEEKSALSLRQWAVSQVDRNDGKTI